MAGQKEDKANAGVDKPVLIRRKEAGQTANAGVDKTILSRRKAGGQWLKRLRIDRGLTQRDLAEKLNLKYYTFIGQLEIGYARLPEKMVGKYATALAIDHDEFMKAFLQYYEHPGLWRNSKFVNS
jgi:DNA-binding XRE family transcriptional regulator